MGVTGPFSRSTGGAVRKYQEWYRQTKPYHVRLPYVSRSTWGSGQTNPHAWAEAVFPSKAADDATNKAYQKFVDKVHGEALMALVNLKERQQTMDMVMNRVVQVSRFARALRRGRFGDAGDVLGLTKKTRPHTARLAGKKFGDTFLEYHFGWSPLIKDIGRGVELLSKPYPSPTVRARSRSTDFRSERTPDPYWTVEEYEWMVRCQIIADVTVSNPNLYRANQVGLINPLAVAWELVPFSFVVDWFIPIGDYFNSFSDFAGISLGNPATTLSGTLKRHTYHYYGGEGTAFRFHLKRSQSVPTVKLVAEVPTRLSPTRAVTAISLLLQQLGRR